MKIDDVVVLKIWNEEDEDDIHLVKCFKSKLKASLKKIAHDYEIFDEHDVKEFIDDFCHDLPSDHACTFMDLSYYNGLDYNITIAA